MFVCLSVCLFCLFVFVSPFFGGGWVRDWIWKCVLIRALYLKITRHWVQTRYWVPYLNLNLKPENFQVQHTYVGVQATYLWTLVWPWTNFFGTPTRLSQQVTLRSRNRANETNEQKLINDANRHSEERFAESAERISRHLLSFTLLLV